MGRFPEWAEWQKRTGTVIKSDGNGNYSLYKNSSKWVPGKKNLSLYRPTSGPSRRKG